MRDILRHLEELSAGLEGHPLYAWMVSRRHADPRRHYDSFIPILGMIVTFPFYNEQYLAYGGEQSDVNDLRLVINEHAREDRTHARFFLHDFRQLHLQSVWGIEKASTLLWALWVSPRLDRAQEVMSRRIRTLVDPRDEWPPFRYLHIEQLEQDGHLLFASSTQKGQEIEASCAVVPRYFAMHHLERESGHVGGEEFLNVVLSDEQAEYARQTVALKHADSVAMNEEMLRFALDAERVDKPGRLLATEQEAGLRQVRERVDRPQPPPGWDVMGPTHPEQSDLLAAYHRQLADSLDHPVFALLRQARGKEAAFALRCAAFLMARRICALRAFYKYDCRVDEAVTGPAAEAVNALGAALATEAPLFFHDWDVLELDGRLGFDMAGLMDFWFFHPVHGRPELEALHEFRREALRFHGDPLIKYWALLSVEFLLRPLLGALAPLAERFGQEHPESGQLVYLSGAMRHLLYEEGTAPGALTHLPVAPRQRAYIRRMMGVFGECGRRLLDSLAWALTRDRDAFAFLG